jgi:hypothetical protein
VPWIYEFDDDIFVRPQPPISADTLSWGDYISIDPHGGEPDERPTVWPLREGVSVVDWLNHERWLTLTCALQTPLFETPITHFLVRAFLAEPLDEFLAHITTLEAALGVQEDHRGKPKIAGHRRLGPTDRMTARVAALLDAKASEDYGRLFDVRSKYVHGRRMDTISGQERIIARQLARRVVGELAKESLTIPKAQSRYDYLTDLLRRGAG